MDSGGEKKKARIESRAQILFLEEHGELVGFDIDLSGAVGSDSCSEISSLPYAPICCRVNLVNNGYPAGMRHVKIGDEHYLLGGGMQENGCVVGYSDKVYKLELDADLCRTVDHNVFKHPNNVLTCVDTRLVGPKFAIVFNLKGKYYLLHASIDDLDMDVTVPFERLDVNRDIAAAAATPFTCHEAPPPSLYYPMFINRLANLNYEASCHFVVDDKLFLFYPLDLLIEVFTSPADDSGNGEWTTLPCSVYCAAESAFDYFTGASVPKTGIVLSEFHVPGDVDGESLAVLLSLQGYIEFDSGESDNEEEEKLEDWPIDTCFFSYQLYAFAISRTTCHPKFCQSLDQIFSDMVPPRVVGGSFSHHLLDLGEGDEVGSRKICAFLTCDALEDPKRNSFHHDNPIHYLFVSTFDLQLIKTPATANSAGFLQISPNIKKFAFRMDAEKGFLGNPVRDAFFI